DEDANEMAERRVAERAPSLELAGEEAGDVVASRVPDRTRIRLERLDEHAPRRAASAPPRELRDQLEGPLLGAKIREREGEIGVDDRSERDPGEVVALGDHLRPEQDGPIGRAEAAQRVRKRLGPGDRVGIEPDPLELRDVPLQLALELLRPGAETRQLGRPAIRTLRRRRLVPAAVVAAQRLVRVQHERDVAERTAERRAAGAAME